MGLNFGVCLRDGRLVCYAVEVLLVVGACCGFGIWFTCTACCEMFSVLVDVGTLVAVYFMVVSLASMIVLLLCGVLIWYCVGAWCGLTVYCF